MNESFRFCGPSDDVLSCGLHNPNALTVSTDRLSSVIRSRAEMALSGAEKNAAIKHEFSLEQANVIIATLKSRFELSENEKLREAISWADVENSLRENPEDLFSIHMLEETGGEPRVIGIDDDEIIIEDRCAETPAGRRDRNFHDANAQRKEFGKNVRFQSHDSYLAMQKIGKHDSGSSSWLEQSEKMRKFDCSIIGGLEDDDRVAVQEVGVGVMSWSIGWRAAIRIKRI
jgi:hypothetical protein